MPVKISDKSQVEQLLDKYDNFLFDCDGVLWLGNKLLPKVTETLQLLRKHGKKLIFVTNNSMKSRDDYVKKIESFGVSASKDEVFGSSYASAVFARKVLKIPQNKKVWVLGGSGIEDEFKDLGYQTVGGTQPEYQDGPINPQSTNGPIKVLDPEVGAVAVGLDKSINYYRLAVTMQYLTDPSIAFIATNEDPTFPADGCFLPGAGVIVESIVTASQRKPYVCGKPGKAMMDAIVAGNKIDKSRSIMIGDRLDTDIKFGVGNDMASLLVLTGVTTENAMHNAPDDQTPTYYASKLGDLSEFYNEH